MDPSSPGVISMDPSSPSVISMDPSSPGVISMDPSSPGVVSMDPSSPGVISMDSSSPGMGLISPSAISTVFSFSGVTSLGLSPTGITSMGLSPTDITSVGLSPPGVTSTYLSLTGVTSIGLSPTGVTSTGLSLTGVTSTGLSLTGVTSVWSQWVSVFQVSLQRVWSLQVLPKGSQFSRCHPPDSFSRWQPYSCSSPGKHLFTARPQADVSKQNLKLSAQSPRSHKQFQFALSRNKCRTVQTGTGAKTFRTLPNLNSSPLTLANFSAFRFTSLGLHRNQDGVACASKHHLFRTSFLLQSCLHDFSLLESSIPGLVPLYIFSWKPSSQVVSLSETKIPKTVVADFRFLPPRLPWTVSLTLECTPFLPPAHGFCLLQQSAPDSAAFRLLLSPPPSTAHTPRDRDSEHQTLGGWVVFTQLLSGAELCT